MINMPRSLHPRRRQRSQLQSPLLRLPPEIRSNIYHLVLVRNEPIDLWPHKWTTSEDQNQSRTFRRSRRRSGGLKVRHQDSLEYVRKEMATGLLGTCTQVFNEASGLFWGQNRFRFSGRSGWQGLLRFFLTIGSEARARIRQLDVHAPIYMRWPEKDTDKKDMNGRSKNFPKLHMAKIPEEGHLDRQAVQRVCMLLAQDRALEEINFLVPASFRNGDETTFGGYTLDHDNDTEVGRLRLQRIERLDWVKKTVVVEKNGYLAVKDGPQQIMDQGWDVTCLPGSFIWEKGAKDKSMTAYYEKHEVSEKRTWRSPARDLDYLEGVKNLFMEAEDISVHANGGRHERRGQRIKLERELRGFGPCAFPEDESNDPAPEIEWLLLSEFLDL